MDHHVVHEPLLLLVVLTVERVNKTTRFAFFEV